MKDSLRALLSDARAAIRRAFRGMRSRAAPPQPATTELAGNIDVDVDVDPNLIEGDFRILDDLGTGDAASQWGEPPDTDAPALHEVAHAGEFIAGSFTGEAGTRAYKLYVPASTPSTARPLVVMLHGCKQNPDDFAAGTQMNQVAAREGVYVLYPAQSLSANRTGCWNWFDAGHQQRDRGEPAIIAGMTRHVIATHPIDPARVFVAGLSAGGAMAAILAGTYPDLYAAVGVHSGLPHAAAHDLMSALSAMRRGPAARRGAAASGERRVVPTIVFHGEDDTVVHPSNGEHVIAQARWTPPADDTGDEADAGDVLVESGEISGGRAFTRTIHRDADGRCDAEHWLVHGAEHAWSGGSDSGSFTDPLGPDASSEMLRFFSEHPLRK